MDTPLVSVLVPCHNYGRYVRACVESMLTQSIGDLDVAILDDGSTDDTWETIQRLAEQDVRVRVSRSDSNRGHVATINELIRSARGRFVVVLDADDVATSPDALRLQIAGLEAAPRAGFAFADYELMAADGSWIGREHSDASPVIPARAAFARLLLGNFVPHSGTLVRAECYETLGGHDPRFHYTHDWEQWLRFTTRYDAVHIGAALYRYRMHARSLRGAAVPERTVPEHYAVLDHARRYSPLPIRQFERLAKRGRANAHVLRATRYLGDGEFRAGLADLLAASRTDFRSLLTSRVPRALLSAVLGLVLGSRKRRVMTAIRLRSTRRSVKR